MNFIKFRKDTLLIYEKFITMRKFEKILSNMSIIRSFSCIAHCQFYILLNCWNKSSKSNAEKKKYLINSASLVVINEHLFVAIRAASDGLAYLRLARDSTATATRCIPRGDIWLTIDRLSIDE